MEKTKVVNGAVRDGSGNGRRTKMKKEINLKNAMAAYDSALLNDTPFEYSIPALDAELEAVQKRCTARTIGLSDICHQLRRVNVTFGISKKAMDGLKVVVDCNAQDFPSAYKYNPESTLFTAHYKNGSWRIASIKRGTPHRLGHNAKILEMPDATAEALVRKYMIIV